MALIALQIPRTLEVGGIPAVVSATGQEVAAGGTWKGWQAPMDIGEAGATDRLQGGLRRLPPPWLPNVTDSRDSIVGRRLFLSSTIDRGSTSLDP